MPTLVISCPICLQKIRAPGRVLGQQIRCPQCKNGFTAVDPASVAAEPLAAPRGMADPPTDPLGLDDDGPMESPAASLSSSALIDYLEFRRMLAPIIVTAVFYFGIAVILLLGLVFAVMSLLTAFGRNGSVVFGLLGLVIDLVATVAALVFWRVGCEVVLVVFRIFDQLRELNERGR